MRDLNLNRMNTYASSQRKLFTISTYKKVGARGTTLDGSALCYVPPVCRAGSGLRGKAQMTYYPRKIKLGNGT